MQSFLRHILKHWLDQRIPPATSVTLNQQRIFIFPSRYGLAYLGMSMGLLLAATNYEKNMIFALAFWLLSLFLVALLHSYINLSGLTITAISAHPAFAGDHAEFAIELSTRKRWGHEDIRIGWPGEEAVLTHVTPAQPTRLMLTHLSHARGWLRPGRLLIESGYPLGLLRVWTWVDPDMQALIYPKPMQTHVRPEPMTRSEAGDDRAQGQQDEFRGFRDYQPGDPLRQVMWKTLAKGQTLQSCLYQDYIDLRQWIDWEQFEGMEREERLARMCWLTLALAKGEGHYGLRLPGLILAPAEGESHRAAVLKELALFELPSAPGQRSPQPGGDGYD
jgi:uncharacterized protein (DUF58 family)